MATVQAIISTSETGAFGVEYNNANGRISGVFCTDPRGLSATATLTDGRAFSGALTAGQLLPIPGTAVRVRETAEGPEFDGLAALYFYWGA